MMIPAYRKVGLPHQAYYNRPIMIMKISSVGLSVVALFLTQIAIASMNSTAVEVRIAGRVFRPDERDYELVRTTIGKAVSEVKVREYVLKAISPEGGFIACIESFGAKAHSQLVQELRDIKVDTTKTAYSFLELEHCN